MLTQTPYSQRRRLQGFEGALAFMQHYRSLCDRLVNQFSGRKLTIDSTGRDWPSCQRQALTLLASPRSGAKKKGGPR